MKTNGFLEPNSKTSAPSAGKLKLRRDVSQPKKQAIRKARIPNMNV
jgi:hypothetical protein